jgi:DNA-binding NarL/FixJ family response regulator
MQTVRVMIVDDHAIVVEALAHLLQTDPRLAVCARARTLAEARLLLAHVIPNVIVLDLRLPDSGGCDTITAIRACCPDARIIVLTGSPGVSEAQARRSGADAYLDKQTESARILDTILRVTSLAPAPGTSTGALSPCELEVARLAAEGLTNAEIAHALHVSGNTVHTHMAHVMDKLRLRSRVDLARLWRSSPAQSHTPSPAPHPNG